MKVICPHCNADVDTVAGPGAIVQCPHCSHLLTTPELPPPVQTQQTLPEPWWQRALAFNQVWSMMIIWDLAMVLVTIGAIGGLVASLDTAQGESEIVGMMAMVGCVSLLIQCGIYWAVRSLKADS